MELQRTANRETAQAAAYRAQRIIGLTVAIAHLEYVPQIDITEGQRQVRLRALRTEVARLRAGGVA